MTGGASEERGTETLRQLMEAVRTESSDGDLLRRNALHKILGDDSALAVIPVAVKPGFARTGCPAPWPGAESGGGQVPERILRETIRRERHVASAS